MTGRGLLGGLVGGAAVVAVALGLSVIDPPGTERMQRLDVRRVEDLAAIINKINDYWSWHQGQLPQTLAVIAGELAGRYSTSDPVIGAPYEYRIETPLSYRLCARFDTEGPHMLPKYYDYDSGLWIEERTIHGTGLKCFAIRQSGS